MTTRIASMDLRGSDVPGDLEVAHEPDGDVPGVTGLEPVVAFARTFNGYAWGGAPHQLVAVVDRVEQRWLDGDGLPSDLDTLRACLFYWSRARSHGPDESVGTEEADWVNALLDAIRQRVTDRD